VAALGPQDPCGNQSSSGSVETPMRAMDRIILALLLAVTVSGCGSAMTTPDDQGAAVRNAVVQWFTAIREENVGAVCALTEGVSGGNAVRHTCADYYRSQYFTPAEQGSFDGGWSVSKLIAAAQQLPLKDITVNGTHATLTMPPTSLGQYNTSEIDLVYIKGSWKVVEYGVAGNYTLPCSGLC
jgi:hypothetical protein